MGSLLLLLVLGTVRDATGLPLPGASIEVAGVLQAVTGDAGEFQIGLPSGTRTEVVVSLPGFEAVRVLVNAREGARLDVVLGVGRVDERVAVVAPAKERQAVRPYSLEPIAVYRTPGAQADVFRALQTLPGVVAPDEGAGLFVRGGDVGEVLVSLDDGVIAHPYRYESPAGGFRGAVDPTLMSGLAFSTGGFGARFGNALSAVVDMRGLEPPAAYEASATAGLAGVSASVGAPLGAHAGARAALNRTTTSVLFAVNGSPRYFDPPPGGWDGSAGMGWSLGRAGRLKAMALAQRDRVGVQVEQDAFVGVLQSASRHRYLGARWDGVVRGWASLAAFGSDAYERQTALGVLDVAAEDRVESWRVEGARSSGRTAWRFGANGTATGAAVDGTVPSRGGDLEGVAGRSAFDVRVRDWFAGSYGEATTRAGPLEIATGLRVDRYGLARATTVDPRVAVRAGLPGAGALRFAAGIYHQAPAASYFDRRRGASSLPPMRAVHYVAGYERGREAEGFYLRAEIYLKPYSRLPVQDDVRGYAGDGYGSARGADLFAQWLSRGVELRGSASWLRARRRWTPADERERYALPDGTWAPDFDVPWSVQLIASVPLPRALSAGASWRSAAGRPHTPILGGVALGGGVAPVFGPLNSVRFARYERLDLSVSRLVPAGGGVAILFASLDNALGRRNVLDYVYARDYSSKTPVVSASPRSVYVGVSFRR